MVTLQKNPDQSFTVLNLTDVQIVQSDIQENSPCLKLFLKTVNELIERSRPQLITISGDITYGDGDSSFEVYRYFAEFIESFETPWAVVWGNHDNQGGTAHIERIVSLFQTYPHFVYESGDKALGNGNYVIAVEESGKIVQGLLMMDTHDRLPYQDSTGEIRDVWAKVTPLQLDWYKEQVNRLKAQGCNDTVLITHIPIYAYREAFGAAFPKDKEAKDVSLEQSYQGECWNDGYKESFGVRYEGECCYPEDEGAFDVIKECQSTKLVLCGHDHVNCWSIRYQGVQLMYALKTGSGCYWSEKLNGGTILKIQSDGRVDAEHLFVDAGE